MEIPLTKGKKAVVDSADYERLAQYVWTYSPCGYAVRGTGRGKYKRRIILMHREIMGLSGGYPLVDHRDRDGLNNRKANLRIATKSQNQMNAAKPKRKDGCSSQYKGVSFDKRTGKWTSYIKLHGKKKSLGYFLDESVAAAAYNSAAMEIYGDFAFPNTLAGGETND